MFREALPNPAGVRFTAMLPELNEVRSNFGSCSTIVWDLLSKEGMDVNDNTDLATALATGATDPVYTKRGMSGFFASMIRGRQ